MVLHWGMPKFITAEPAEGWEPSSTNGHPSRSRSKERIRQTIILPRQARRRVEGRLTDDLPLDSDSRFTCSQCGCDTATLDDVMFVYYSAPVAREVAYHCGFTCAECKRMYYRNRMKKCSVCDSCIHESEAREGKCVVCWSWERFQCAECEERGNIEDAVADNSPSIRIRLGSPAMYCHDCFNGRMQPYSTHFTVEDAVGPRPDSGERLFGVELEVEYSPASIKRSKMVAGVREVMGDFVIIKPDASVSKGFEIVTKPCMRSVHEEQWTKLLTSNIAKRLRSWNTTSCGLHVHASRINMTENQMARVVCFVNASFNRRFMYVIAGRRAEDWAKFVHKTADSALHANEKYEAVNLMNAHTLEFRIFRGTTKLASVLKAIEFADAIIKYCKVKSSFDTCMRRSRFIRYVAEHHEEFPHLHSFIQARWLGISTPRAEEFGYEPVRIRDIKSQQKSDKEL